MEHKSCIGLCDRCVWYRNGGCSEWNGAEKTTALPPVFPAGRWVKIVRVKNEFV